MNLERSDRIPNSLNIYSSVMELVARVFRVQNFPHRRRPWGVKPGLHVRHKHKHKHKHKQKISRVNRE